MKPNPNAPQVLIADDQRDVLESLRLLLKGEGYQIEAVTSPAAVFTAVEGGGLSLFGLGPHPTPGRHPRGEGGEPPGPPPAPGHNPPLGGGAAGGGGGAAGGAVAGAAP